MEGTATTQTSASRIGHLLLAFAVYGIVAAIICLPLAAERAVERASFDDRLGSLPVEVTLSHNGVSTLDTGVLGKLYWDRTGVGGLGASLRSTGPPEAGGTLTSYVSPKFLRANAVFVNDPAEVARVYGNELRSQVIGSVVDYEVIAFVLGGLLLTVVFRGRGPYPARCRSPWSRIVVAGGLLVLGVAASTLLSAHLFDRWAGSAEVADTYPMPDVSQLSFSSPQTREIAQQIQPFITKMTTRIAERTSNYEDAAELSMNVEIPAHADGLVPRDGEHVVIAEADPQGSLVGTAVRTVMYPLLEETLGDDAIVLRTISGDVSSNGTVAEEGFVRKESTASPGIPVVAVKGDHDSDNTVDQLVENGVAVLDQESVDVGGLRVVGAADPDFKALFGGMVTNDSGVTEADIGSALRAEVDDEDPVVVVLHQPRAASAYLGIPSTATLRTTSEGHETVPWDDGIDDVPPGSVNIGHLHDVSGPWVVWNTDGDLVTWTVVSQLGTAGGVEENPTFNRFSTPISVPLKAVSVQLQYVNDESGLQTGFAAITIATDGSVSVTDRIDLGLPGGQPMPTADLAPSGTADSAGSSPAPDLGSG